jgi:hypothetical protein
MTTTPEAQVCRRVEPRAGRSRTALPQTTAHASDVPSLAQILTNCLQSQR